MFKKYYIFNIFLLFWVSVCLYSCGSSGIKKGDLAPDFVLPNYKNENVKLETYLNKKDIVLYFADPYEKEVPSELSQLQAYYNGNEDKIAIIGIMLESTRQEVGQLIRKNKLTFPLLLGSDVVAKQYGVGHSPVLIVIGKDGKVYYRRKDVNESIASIMEGPNVGIKIKVDETAKTKEKIKLVYWRIWEPESVFEPMITSFEKSHPDVDIEYKQIPLKDYKDALIPALKVYSPGVSPDMFEIHASWLPYYIDELSSIPPQIFSREEYEKTFYDFVTNAFTANDSLWAISFEANTLTLFYNIDLFRQAGLPDKPPETWDELVKYAKAIKEKTGKWGAAIGTVGTTSQDHNVLEAFAVQNGARPISDDLKRSLVNQSKFVEALQFYTDFVRKHNVFSETAGKDTDLFTKGECGMFISGSWSVNAVRKAGINFGTAPLPRRSKDSDRYTHATFWGEVVNADSRHKDLAWMFLKFCASKENMFHFYKETKRPPTRYDLETQVIASDSLMKPFIEQARYAGMWFKPWEDKWKESQNNAIKAVLLGTPPDEALDIAAAEETAMLASYVKPYKFSVRLKRSEIRADTTKTKENNK